MHTADSTYVALLNKVGRYNNKDMPVVVEMLNTGDSRVRAEVVAMIEHVFSDRPGDWRVSIAGSRENDTWEMKIDGPKGFERSYTLIGGAGQQQPAASLWYTGQGANKLGRLDPKTGEFKEFPLKTPNSGPHGLVADKEGNIWFTAISGGYIGKLDPKSGAITEYHAPQGAEIDPHTPVFDHNGILWFTNEETNYIGRLDPTTGKMILARSPNPQAVPYGIVVTRDNVPFFCEFGTNKLASIDPNTMKIREYTLPAANARPRRIALAPDGTIYYTDYARGYLGHFDPAGGKLLKEWASPGGTGSEPYGIAVTKDGEVWYSESGMKPNTLVKFDPKSESFGTEPIPSGGGVVRNMVATPDRRLYLACSGVNKVAVVDLNR